MGLDLNLPTGVTVEKEKDSLGGGQVLDTGIYKGVLEMCYHGVTDKGTNFIDLHFKYKNNVYKHKEYISNRDGEFSVTKDGVTRPMFGYAKMDSLFKLITGRSLAENGGTTDKRFIKIFDFATMKDKNTEVEVFTDVLNIPVAIAISKINEEKTTPESNYTVGTGEFRQKNTFVKYFNADTGLTLAEIADGVKSPVFFNSWRKKYDGVTITKKAKIAAPSNVGAAVGMPTGNTAATTTVETDDIFANG